MDSTVARKQLIINECRVDRLYTSEHSVGTIRTWTRDRIPAIWILASLWYISIYHLTNTLQLAAIGAIVLSGVRSKLSLTALSVAAAILLLTTFFTVGDPFFSISWFLSAVAVAFMREQLAEPQRMVKSGRVLIRGVALYGLVGFMDQYFLHSALFRIVNRLPRTLITYDGSVDRFEGFFLQPNGAGMYLVVVLSIGIGLWFGKQLIWVDKLAILVIAVLLGATLSRASVIASLCVLIAAIITQRRFASRAVAATILVALIAGGLQIPAVWAYISTAFSTSYQSNVARQLIYKGAVEAIYQSPIVGYGFGRIAAVLPQFVPAGYPGIPVPLDNAHDLFLGLSLWAGVPFAITMLAFIVAASARSVVPGPHLPFSLGSLAILVNCLFDSPLTSLQHLPLYMVTVAAALAIRVCGTDDGPPSLKRPLAGRALLSRAKSLPTVASSHPSNN